MFFYSIMVFFILISVIIFNFGPYAKHTNLFMFLGIPKKMVMLDLSIFQFFLGWEFLILVYYQEIYYIKLQNHCYHLNILTKRSSAILVEMV